MMDTVGYLEMVRVEKNAKLVTTDSGGVRAEGVVLLPRAMRDFARRNRMGRAGGARLKCFARGGPCGL